MARAPFRLIWVGCLALLMLPEVGFVQEPKFRSLQTYKPQDHYLRHVGFLARVSPAKSDQDVKDAQFRIVPGLADKNCISFESTNVRDHYLKHAFFRIVLAKRLDERKFSEDATFCTVWGLHKTRRSGTDSMSFRSFNFPNRYIRHRNLELWLDPFENTASFRDEATFFMVQPAARDMSFDGDTMFFPVAD